MVADAYTIMLSKVCEGRLCVALPGTGADGCPEVRVVWSQPLSNSVRSWSRARTPRVRAVTLVSFAVQLTKAVRTLRGDA